MRLTHYIYLCLVLLAVSSCLGTEPEYEYSNSAEVRSLKFSKNDSIPYLETAVFTIDNENNLIYNIDSLPYKTRIDSVNPVFSFESTSGSVLFLGKDTVYLTGTDTIDFTQQPIILRNYPASGNEDSVKQYTISVNVHQTDPELYVWNRTNEQIYSHTSASQKMLWFNNELHLFVSSGINNYLYTSTNGVAWDAHTPTGLLPNTNFRSMMEFKGTLYLANQDALYQSTDAVTWQKMPTTNAAYKFVNLLFAFDKKLVAIMVDNSGEYFMAQTTDMVNWTIDTDVIPENFPVQAYASLAYKTAATGKEKALVLGGFSANNELLNTRWSTENGDYWVNLGEVEPAFGSMANASIVQYDDKFLMFGGTDDNNQVLEHSMLESTDEGMSWTAPDTAMNVLPEAYKLRFKQSVAVDADHNIYIVGGQNRTEFFYDAWRGKLNRMGFATED